MNLDILYKFWVLFFIFVVNSNAKNIQFTKIQKDYLDNKKTITMCIDPNWMPFEKFDKNGNHVGISADYMKLFSKNLNINIKAIVTTTWDETLKKAKNRECDIISLAMQTKKRKEYLNFTLPYLTIPLVVTTTMDKPFIDNIAMLKDKSIGLPKGYAFVELFKTKYPFLKILEVQDINDGLKKVNSGELFAYIGTLASVSYQFQKGLSGNLKISGKLKESWELCTAVRNDDKILLDILNIVIKNIDSSTHQNILNRWISIKYDDGINLDLIIKISIFFYIILFILLYGYFKQKKLKNELKKQKEYFETIFKSSKDAIGILDMDTNFLKVNDEYSIITGYSSEELLKTACINLTLEEDILISKDAMKNIKEKGFIKNFDKRCITKSGNVIDVNMSMTLLKNPQRILISARDVTDIKRKDNALVQQNKLASMGEMMANIAHQWRQPLSVISTCATGMQVQKEYNILSDDEFIKSCNAIVDNTEYLSNTIDDFTNFVKGDRKIEKFNLRTQTDSFLNLIKQTIDYDNIDVILDINEHIEVKGYPSELMQCYINIFNNAKDALKNNSIKNKIIFISDKSTKDNIIISFKDNGGGIPNEVLPKIFDPYFTTKHQSQGTGLGLHMTYSIIVDGMNGMIEATNVKYKYNNIEYEGAEFTITLPLS